ncbi:MAG: type IX secretion system outer membrane channel protein PorV [Bacteroidales bacterium]|nr:type IX secretion system outer membrane channel protein PorV [Bacteroidales bacterium]MBO5854339.1 type IX secretion system outer membrane channel protein PorV [Bacteroidales bacterium]
MRRIKIFTLLFVMLFTGIKVNAQSDATIGEVLGQNLEYNVISTAVPFMSIAPDARSSAMGDVGVSTSPDVYSMHWNPAKYAFIQEDFSVGLAYSPWLRTLVNDMNIAYLGMAKRVSPKSTVAATMRYFTLGDINYRDPNNEDLGTYSPNEWAVDVAYSRKLGKYISGSVAGRFIYSNLTQGIDTYSKPAVSVAADVAVYYTRDVEWFNNIGANISWGAAITNIGSKMNYDESTLDKDFIPTNLRFGPTLKLDIDDYNSLAFSVDFNKLLVPTPPTYYADSVGANGGPVIAAGMDNEVGLVQGMIQSFYDAPGGFKEELKEFTLGFGAEYWYNQVFTVRGGFFHEAQMKGNRRYVTLGAGLRYNVFSLDVSYLIPVNNTATSGQNPLENTLRFSLTFNIDKWADNTKLEKVE